MSIISLKFIGFCVLLVAAYFLLPRKCQWVVLLTASALFYLTGGLNGCVYILVTIVSQYLLALGLERKNRQMGKKLAEDSVNARVRKEIKRRFNGRKRVYVVFSLLINLGILAALKYLNPTLETVNQTFGTAFAELDVLVPLGLSYYTFKSTGYVIDVYRDRVPAQKNIFKLALYISYFPELIQGPIDRYGDVAEQLFAEHDFDYDRLCFGAQRMLWGYIKKLVIAERATILINHVNENFAVAGYEGFTIFFMMVLGAFRLYADFSGGMDIVLGLSEIFGIRLTENFERPFFARSISEYWQRWHITLGVWFRTYVFYPLSLSQGFNKLGKKCRKLFGDKYGKLISPTLASFVTFFLIGIWHGAGTAYLPFGLYNAFFVSMATLLEDFYASCRDRLGIREESKPWHVFQGLRTVFLVTVSRYLILTKTPDKAGLIRATLRRFNPWIFFDGTLYNLGLEKHEFWVMIAAIAVLLLVDCLQEKGVQIRRSVAGMNLAARWFVYLSAAAALIVFGMYGPGFSAADFVYERF